MRGRPIAFIAIAAFPFLAWALDWPAASPVVTGEFGSSLMGRPLPGLILSGDGIEVRAAGKAEVSFVRSALDARSRLPSSLGATLVTEGSDGIAEIYGFLPEISDASAKSVLQGSLLAKSGAAGLLRSPGFMFALYDRRSGRWVNPRLFLPAIEDKKAPSVRRASLVGKDKTYVLGEDKSLPQGSYSIVLEVAEQSGAGGETVLGPPFFLRVLVNGSRLMELKAEVAGTAGGRLSFYPDEKGGAELIDRDGRVRLEARQFNRGRTSIELLTRDHAGNERTLGWTVTVE